ncbi:MAG: SDR family NAD(P)-dependent oxidoreductase [Geminicoccaceae bacterium]|jgi:short-subunit dehydrogenase|nr:SDR family NAD(P)-dependent oxidoreductase [Geminicoccaceae bacterium]MCB9968621.1 SDR family NAD(P)-dependent oxidoreductase [Geminicoccaceae bacterium]HRY23177.1 SDR family NAD(P)-dependent oxidoreductase [Geminicoccaceae bacterium]
MVTERVWIIGASSGIGAALAERLAGDGKEVWASARSVGKLEALAGKHPGYIHALPLDVTDKAAVQAALARIESACGPPDTVVLNAGTHQPVAAKDFTADGLRQVMELNVFGVANGIEAVLPGMLERDAGRIAVVASVAGYQGLPTSAYYGASKAALINMIESLRFDLRRTGVVLQLVNPGFVRTPLTDRNEFPMPFLIEADEAAAAIARGLEVGRFEIAFPTVFVWLLKLLGLLPYRAYFALVGRSTGK